MYHFRRYVSDCLRHVCRTLGVIPSAMYLDVKFDSSEPFAIGHSADMFSGVWRGHPVAIKSIRGAPGKGTDPQNVCTFYDIVNLIHSQLMFSYIPLRSRSFVRLCIGTSSDTTTSLR